MKQFNPPHENIMSTTIKRVINDWQPEVRSLLARLQSAGFTLVSGHNGEEKFQFKDGDLGDFIGNLIACDEAWLFVKSPTGKRYSLFLVLGNSPGEIVADYERPSSEADSLDPIVDAHYIEWQDQPQPTKQIES